MRFMIIVKATRDSEAGVMPSEELIAAMATYHEQLHKGDQEAGTFSILMIASVRARRFRRLIHLHVYALRYL